MDVRCDRCRTEYEFDESRLTEAGVAVKCTACGNVFKVKKPAPLQAAPIDLERPRQWKVRRADGQVYALKDLPELQRWIVERRVSRDDEVSLSGDAWRKLGSMPELASFFEIVEAAEQAQRLAGAQPAAAIAPATAPTMISPGSAPTPAFGRPAVTVPQSTGSASWEGSPQAFASAPNSEPAWTASPSVSAIDDDLAAEDLKHVRGSPWPGILVTLVVLGGLGGGGYYFMKQMQKNQPAVPAPVAASGPAAPVPGASGPAAATGAVAASGPATPAPPPAAAKPPAAPGPVAAETAKPSPAAPEAAKPPPAKTEPKPDAKPEAKTDTALAAADKVDAKPAAKAEGAEGAKGGHDFNWYMAKGHKLLDTHPSQAIGMFEQAVEANPSSPEPDSGRGIAYSNLEQWPKAIAAFQSAIQKNPEFNEAVMGLAEAYRYSGNKKQALLYYKRYLDLTPDGPDAPAAKAQIGSLKDE